MRLPFIGILVNQQTAALQRFSFRPFSACSNSRRSISLTQITAIGYSTPELASESKPLALGQLFLGGSKKCHGHLTTEWQLKRMGTWKKKNQRGGTQPRKLSCDKIAVFSLLNINTISQVLQQLELARGAPHKWGIKAFSHLQTLSAKRDK